MCCVFLLLVLGQHLSRQVDRGQQGGDDKVSRELPATGLGNWHPSGEGGLGAPWSPGEKLRSAGEPVFHLVVLFSTQISLLERGCGYYLTWQGSRTWNSQATVSLSLT